jgi:protein-tyrosine-phosphatase
MAASPPPVLPDERLASGIARLALRRCGHFSLEAIQGVVTDSYARLAEHACVRTHLVVLAHRTGGHVDVSFAGTRAAAEVEPVVAQALTEAGADLTDAYPKSLTGEVVRAADIVMGCGDACPVVPGRRCLDWPVSDPEGVPIASSEESATRSTPTSPNCSTPCRALDSHPDPAPPA